MKTYGLFGFPLTHSFSVKYFADKFAEEGIVDCVYNNYAIESVEELPDVIRQDHLVGFNVTIPYKEAVIEYLHEIDETADAIGAVNCVKIVDDRLIGYNTDAYGFTESLKRFIGDRKLSALILGSGGSSKAVAYALKVLDIPYRFVSRRKKAEWLTYNELTAEVMDAHKLIINTTPLGMFPNAENAPLLPYPLLTPEHFLFDLIYNPAETEFLHQGKEHGANTINGLEMLHFQAVKNWEIWNTKTT